MSKLDFTPQEPTPECVFQRCQEFYDALIRRGFSDDVATRAVEVSERVALAAIDSGKARLLPNRTRWMWKVAKTAANRLAKKGPICVPLNEDWLIDRRQPEELIDVKAAWKRSEKIEAAIRELSERQCTAIMLVRFERFSLGDAAKAMNICVGALRQHLNRAQERLADVLSLLLREMHSENV